MTIGIAVALIVIAAALGAVGVTVLNTAQQRSVDRANRIMPGEPTRAPRSWALSHQPEAKLHRRLRDAMAAMRTVDTVETGTALVLRVDLERSAIDLDDHLVAVSRLPGAQRDEQLQTITEAVACVERGVAAYTAAAAPDTTALEADLAAVQGHLDTVTSLQKRLGG